MTKRDDRRSDPLALVRMAEEDRGSRRGRRRRRPCGNVPAAPANVTLTFSTVEKERHDRIRAKVRWDEVTTDTAGIGGEKIARYAVQLQKSDDGAAWTDDPRRMVIEAKDEDADSIAHALFHNIRKRYWYRARVRAANKDGCRGAWSAWTAGATPSDATAPPTPLLVTIFAGATNRVAIDWDTPTDSADADLPDPDVAYFQVQISTSSTFATIYKFDRYQVITKRSFKVATADEGSTFYARVRSVDSSGNKSSWVAATLTGNSSPGTPADGVTIGKGGGGERAVFHVRGRLRVLDEADSHELDIDEALTITKVRCRVKQAPTGADAIFKVWKNNTTLVATVTMTAGTKRAASDGLSVGVADADGLSVEVVQVGSTFPGRHLTVKVVMS